MPPPRIGIEIRKVMKLMIPSTLVPPRSILLSSPFLVAAASWPSLLFLFPSLLPRPAAVALLLWLCAPLSLSTCAVLCCAVACSALCVREGRERRAVGYYSSWLLARSRSTLRQSNGTREREEEMLKQHNSFFFLTKVLFGFRG